MAAVQQRDAWRCICGPTQRQDIKSHILTCKCDCDACAAQFGYRGTGRIIRETDGKGIKL